MTDRFKNLCGAIAGASFVALIQLSTVKELTGLQEFTVGCFAIVLPLFAVVAGSLHFSEVKENSSLATFLNWFLGNAGIVFLVGITTLIWSFGWLFGVLFLISMAIGIAAAFAAGRNSN